MRTSLASRILLLVGLCPVLLLLVASATNGMTGVFTASYNLSRRANSQLRVQKPGYVVNPDPIGEYLCERGDDGAVHDLELS